jgi:L-ascorbate metabolism protein UlaG (beta-lactamase superfamily)
MFDIEYKGGNAVVITTKKTTVVADPKLSNLGLKDVSAKGAVEVATEERLIVRDGELLLIEGPGEYEVGDFSLRGVSAIRHIDVTHDDKMATIYRLEVGDTRIALIGNIAPKLSEEQLEALGVIDIVILPVGGGGLTLDATSAASLVRQIEPKVVIPTHYADPALTYEMSQDTLEVFIKELGAPVETVAKYKVKATTSLPAVLTTVEVTRS